MKLVNFPQSSDLTLVFQGVEAEKSTNGMYSKRFISGISLKEFIGDWDHEDLASPRRSTFLIFPLYPFFVMACTCAYYIPSAMD